MTLLVGSVAAALATLAALGLAVQALAQTPLSCTSGTLVHRATALEVQPAHSSRQCLAREFGATDIVAERGDAGVAAIKELTDGLGAHSVVEAVDMQESMNQALHATRAGGQVGFVGVAPGVALDGMDLFWSLAHVHDGPAPVRRFLPELIDLIWNRQIDRGKVFDLHLPLERAPAGSRATVQRDAIKTLLRP